MIFPTRALMVAILCLVHPGSASAQADAAAAGAQAAVAPAAVSAPPQAAPAPAAQANAPMLYPGEDFKLSAGDLISVHVFQQTDYESTVRISAEGTVQLPFIGSVPVEGLSVHEAQTRIADRLRAGQFYRDPEVIIQVLDTVNSSVIITGEMHSVIPVSTERSLRDVLLTAGGLPATASHTIKIVRQGQLNPIVVDLGTDLASSTAANIMVRPHDMIQISRASVVYVLGAFQHQGAIPLDQAQPLTLLQLAALSGGINFEGRYNDLRLIRTVIKDGKPDRVLVPVDIKKVRDGKADDPILQANDIVFLPTNEMKAALKSIGSGGVIGLVSLLITTRSY
jgi:polysaccharide export outer membrane protein